MLGSDEVITFSAYIKLMVTNSEWSFSYIRWIHVDGDGFSIMEQLGGVLKMEA